MLTLVPVFALLTTVFAVPAASDATYCYPTSEPKCAEYDDLAFNEGEETPIPAAYNGLDYRQFQVDQFDGFIPPTSGNQWAMSHDGTGVIRLSDEAAKTQSIDLHSFSYACVAGIPQPECQILVFAFKESGDIITREITFPKLDPGHYIDEFYMNKTDFDDEWKGLKGVAFQMTRKEDGGDMFGGLAIDDLRYTLNTDC